MDENLQRLARELRQERCPQRVLDEVARRVSAQECASPRFDYRLAAVGLVLVLLSALALWRWSPGEAARLSPEVARNTRIDNARVAEQTQASLGYIGQILLQASTHSGQGILKEAVPPLRNSFETTKSKLSNYIEL